MKLKDLEKMIGSKLARKFARLVKKQGHSIGEFTKEVFVEVCQSMANSQDPNLLGHPELRPKR